MNPILDKKKKSNKIDKDNFRLIINNNKKNHFELIEFN